MRRAWLVIMSLALLARVLFAVQPAPAARPSPCETASESPLPLPSGIPPERLADYEKQVFAFLKAGTYVQLGWCGDKRVRDTGPWIGNTSYGTCRRTRSGAGRPWGWPDAIRSSSPSSRASLRI